MSESNFWKQIKRNLPDVMWTRIESSTGLGIPDLFGFCERGFWVELKLIKNKKLLFSPHQIAWINRHFTAGCPVFVLAKDPLSKSIKLFPGSIVHSPSNLHSPLATVEHDTWSGVQDQLSRGDGDSSMVLPPWAAD